MIDLPIRLAPMAGITDWPFRTLCFEQGAQLCYTEMISAMGYLSAPKKSVAMKQLLEIGPDEGPIIAQLFGREPEIMAKAAIKLEETGKFIGIDINMGCPAHKVVGSNEGSALMKDLGLASAIMEAVTKAATLPISVKMRLGWDENHINCVELAKRAQQAGVREIAVHGRTRTQFYSGKADWQAIKQVKEAVSIPVLANGDIFHASDALSILEVTGCDGLMVGRGALGNPWLFAPIKARFNGVEAAALPTLEQRVDMALRQTVMMVQWKGEDIAVKEMRKHVAWYIQGVRGAAQMRARVNQAGTFEDLQKALMEIRAS